MKDIYLTGTFRNDWNRDFNIRLVRVLEEHGLSVYMPQRDTEQGDDRRKTYDQNIAGIDNAKIVLAVGAKTQTANWGLEIGYALKAGKSIIILTDKEHPAELMAQGAANKIIVVDNLEHIETYQTDLLSAIKTAHRS